jgi:hypothetical protein
MKPLGICPFSAEKVLLHCFEEADHMGVEEIPHPQNNQQDFNSFIAKFTDKNRQGSRADRLKKPTRMKNGAASLREGNWVILRIPPDRLLNYTPKSSSRNETMLLREPLSPVSGVRR